MTCPTFRWKSSAASTFNFMKPIPAAAGNQTSHPNQSSEILAEGSARRGVCVDSSAPPSNKERRFRQFGIPRTQRRNPRGTDGMRWRSHQAFSAVAYKRNKGRFRPPGKALSGRRQSGHPVVGNAPRSPSRKLVVAAPPSNQDHIRKNIGRQSGSPPIGISFRPAEDALQVEATRHRLAFI